MVARCHLQVVKDGRRLAPVDHHFVHHNAPASAVSQQQGEGRSGIVQWEVHVSAVCFTSTNYKADCTHLHQDP
jgi:hypothetical protein